jgi:hypothetical protein
MLNRALLVLNICCKSNAAVTLRLKVFAKTSDINGVQNNGQLQSAEHAVAQLSDVRAELPRPFKPLQAGKKRSCKEV